MSAEQYKWVMTYGSTVAYFCVWTNLKVSTISNVFKADTIVDCKNKADELGLSYAPDLFVVSNP